MQDPRMVKPAFEEGKNGKRQNGISRQNPGIWENTKNSGKVQK